MSRIAEWLNQQYPQEPALSTIKRDGRGIHHPITGMLLCPIRYDWDDEAYTFSWFLWIGSANVHKLIGYAPSFVRQTPATITLLTFAFAAFIEVLMDPATTQRRDFYRAHCL